MVRYNQQQLIDTIEELNNEIEELRSKLFKERVEASNTLNNRLRDEYMEEARLIKELDKKHVEMMTMAEELAKAKEEIDSLYKLVNLLDK